MRAKYIIIMIAAIAVSGCGLTSTSGEAFSEPSIIEDIILTATQQEQQEPNTQIPVATVLVTITATPVVSLNDVDITVPVENHENENGIEQIIQPTCTVQHAEWSIYSVVAGDNLSQVANRFNTTVDILVQVNCLTDINAIYVGQSLKVPPVNTMQSTLPLIDMGPFPNDVCAVMPNGQQAIIYGTGISNEPVAILTGSVRFVNWVDNAYVVDLPGFNMLVWVYTDETQLLGSACPQSPIEIINPTPTQIVFSVVGGSGEAPSDSCSVVRNIGIHEVRIFRKVGDDLFPMATLGSYLPFVAATPFGYEVELPGNVTGYVWTTEVHLEGYLCPT